MTGLIILVLVIWALVFVPIVWFTFYRARKFKVEQKATVRAQKRYWADHGGDSHPGGA